MRWRAVMQGAFVAAASVTYAAASYVCARSAHPTLLGAGLAYAPLLLGGVWMAWKSLHRIRALAVVVLAALVLWFARDVLLQHYRWGYLVQNIGPMTLLALLFGSSLRRGRVALITQFALLAHDGHISARTSRYTRGLTWAWTVFFAVMALVSTALFLVAAPAVWSLFADVLVAPLVAIMFVGEYAVRVLVLPAHERTGPLQAVAAFMRYRRRGSATAVPLQPAIGSQTR
ncbi:MAG: hypothetical protein KGL42_02615 [Betaproteobacteria bacterium]|nr:hypothetical protein [Betaproteobacteria bacterium]